MAQIVHLSDVHFGRHDPAAVRAVLSDLDDAPPDLVVISGDLTQRARRSEFRLAREFLRQLETRGLKWLAVPGNHDIPLYDVARRLLVPLKRFRHYITADLAPRFDAPGVRVVGLNTARSLTVSDGRVSVSQIAALADDFAGTPDEAMRVLVTHHPLVALPWGARGAALPAAGRASLAIAAADAAGVHLLLAGHHHRSFAASAERCADTHGGVLVVQAGTATSTRTRTERNSYNRLKITPATVEISVRVRSSGAFETVRTECHRLEAGRWTAI